MKDNDLVMDDEAFNRYYVTRQFWEGITPEEVGGIERIILWNGFSHEELRRFLINEVSVPSDKLRDYMPPASAERRIYVADFDENLDLAVGLIMNSINIPNVKSNAFRTRQWLRHQRWANGGMEFMEVLSGNPLYLGDKYDANLFLDFERYGKSLIDRIFSGNEVAMQLYDVAGQPFPRDFSDEGFARYFRNITMGPIHGDSNLLEILHEAGGVSVEIPDDYVNAALFDICGQKGISFGYMFGDQAATVARLLGEKFVEFKDRTKKPVEIKLFGYGRIGGIAPDINIQDVAVPTRVIDESRIGYAKDDGAAIKNCFEYDEDAKIYLKAGAARNNVRVHTGTDVNSSDVTYQSKKSLGRGIGNNSQKFVEQELRGIYRQVLDINQHSLVVVRSYFANDVSDLPLTGPTLADYLPNRNGRRACVEAVLDVIAGKELRQH